MSRVGLLLLLLVAIASCSSEHSLTRPIESVGLVSPDELVIGTWFLRIEESAEYSDHTIPQTTLLDILSSDSCFGDAQYRPAETDRGELIRIEFVDGGEGVRVGGDPVTRHEDVGSIRTEWFYGPRVFDREFPAGRGERDGTSPPDSGVCGAEASYSLSGSCTGGRLLLWSSNNGPRAELTIYGTGVPMMQSRRGSLLRPTGQALSN